MPAIFESLPFMVAAVLFVSVAYGFWMWSRFRIGRMDALFSSIMIIAMQGMSAVHAMNPGLALVAAAYHAALVGAVYTASKSILKTPAKAHARSKTNQG